MGFEAGLRAGAVAEGRMADRGDPEAVAGSKQDPVRRWMRLGESGGQW